jgi:DNA polymerase III epsilon subunit-like protein
MSGQLIVFDVETDGLSVKTNHIIQIGAVRSDGKRFLSYVNIGSRLIPDIIVKLTKITNEDLRGAPSFPEVFQNFLTFISEDRKNDEPVTLAAYNGMSFDFPMLLWNARKYDIVAHLHLANCGVTYLLDPLLWARSNMPVGNLFRRSNGLYSYTMGSVYKAMFNEEIENAHDAYADAKALFRMVSAAKSRYQMDCDHESKFLCKFRGFVEKMDTTKVTATKKRKCSSLTSVESSAYVKLPGRILKYLRTIHDLEGSNAKRTIRT